MNNTDGYFGSRLKFDAQRTVLWKTLCASYFQKFAGKGFHVLEIGCGYGDFINNIQAAEKTAVDSWEGSREYLNSDVRFFNNDAADLSFLKDRSIDFVFISNVLEHLPQESFRKILTVLKSKLKSGGTINIVQPNFKYCVKEYFDDYTHVTIYTDTGLSDLAESYGYTAVVRKPKFLPLSIKSRFPVLPFLIRLYLVSPVKPFAKQMFLQFRLNGSAAE